MKSVKRQIVRVPDKRALTRKAAEAIAFVTQEALGKKKRAAIALSGGTTPGSIYSLLASDETLRKQIKWPQLHFFWGDERHVPPDHPDSNYRMAYQSLLSRVPLPTANIHRIPAELPDAVRAAETYEQEIRTFFGPRVKKYPPFDCVILGMGADGHTASLFPGTAALKEQDRLVAANWIETLQAYRITLTPPVLNKARTVLFLVSGAEKADTLRTVLEGDYQPDQYPAQIVRPVRGKVVWIIDEAAASRLSLEEGHDGRTLFL